MYTSCPKCALTLVVTTADLRAAQGFVRCGRCSNVFNALANLSEDRQAGAASPAPPQTQSAPPRQTSESGTPEESPVYQEAPPSNLPLTRVASPPQPVPPAQRAAPPPQPAPRAAPPLQNSFAPRGTTLPPPTADDLDDIPDISLEFDAESDISQVFVQQPARRLVLDSGNSGVYEALTPPPAPPPPPEPEVEEEDDDISTQLQSLAAQLNPSAQPAPPPAPPAQQAVAQPARAAPAARQNASAPSSDTSSTGRNPVLRMPQSAPDTVTVRQVQAQPQSDTVTVRQVQAPPAQPDTVTVRQVQSPPAQQPDTVTVRRVQSPSAQPVARQSAQSSSAVAEPPPMVRQSSGAPAREAAPQQRQAAARGKSNARAAKEAPPRSRGRSPEELIQAAAEVVKRAGRRRVANGGEVEYDDEPEPDINVVPDISESFPTRIRRRAVQAIETDSAALRARLPSLSWGTAAVALSALFVLQVINHYRNELATSDRLRKPLTSFYKAFGVTLVPRWDLGAYEVRQLGALAGAGGANQLTVRLSVKNGAKSAQPLPYLRVTVQDRFGNRVASRDVPPEVYAPKRAPGELLDADQRVDAEIAFVDPGQNAVGFEIDACLPKEGGRIACANDQIAR